MRRLAVLILAALLLQPPAGADENGLALAVKAAYLVKVQPFITWPATAFPNAGAPFAICVAGQDPFGSLLDRATAGLTFQGRPILVRRLPQASAAAGCQILFLASSDPQMIRQSLAALRGQPVLTVTDSMTEPGAQGILNFMVIDDRVRFAIDDDAAERSGLDISSKLLSLAVWVRHKGVKE
jgi:hypothetical protein